MKKKKKRKKTEVPISKLRSIAHEEFDSLWMEGPYPLKRADAYEWLAEKMGIPLLECHFALFNREQLLQVLEIMEVKHDFV